MFNKYNSCIRGEGETSNRGASKLFMAQCLMIICIISFVESGVWAWGACWCSCDNHILTAEPSLQHMTVISSSVTFYLILETSFLTKPKAHWLTGFQVMSFRDPSLSVSPVLRLQRLDGTPKFVDGSWDLNSCPGTCIASTLWTDPSQPVLLILIPYVVQGSNFIYANFSQDIWKWKFV